MIKFIICQLSPYFCQSYQSFSKCKPSSNLFMLDIYLMLIYCVAHGYISSRLFTFSLLKCIKVEVVMSAKLLIFISVLRLFHLVLWESHNFRVVFLLVPPKCTCKGLRSLASYKSVSSFLFVWIVYLCP